MKFSDGYWRVLQGFSAAWARQTHDVAVAGNALRAHVSSNLVKDRGDTLGGPVFTITLSTPGEGVIKVVEEHFRGAADHGPYFTLNVDDEAPFSVERREDGTVFRSGDLEAVISPEGGVWSMSFRSGDRDLTGTAYKGLGAYIGPDGTHYMREQLRLSVGEHAYGFGERFGHFVKNGQTVEMWNSDAGTSSDAVYKAIPFYWTDRGYGVFVNHAEDVSFEVGSETVGKIQFSTKGHRLEYYVIDGPEPKDVLRRYTALTGRVPRLPAWSYGLWLTTSFLTDYDDETVAGFVDGMAERNIPLSVFHYDCFWLKEYHFCELEWDGDMFRDPERTIAEQHRKGLRVCVWINPYVSSLSPMFDEAKEHGYLLRQADGGVCETDFWQPGMGFVDFTKPEACAWYAAKLEKLMDMGVDCFKTDFGESVPVDAVYENGSDPVKMHNYYTQMYNKTVFDVLERRRGKGEAVLFARSATVGGQRFPVHWGGDCESSYDAMAESLRGGLSLMSSGFSYWAHDIGGFEGNPSPDLYKRWVQFGLLSTHSRLHGSHSVRVPWAFDEESCDVLRTFVNLKLSLLPYLAKGSDQATCEGVPLMRPMVLEFPHDPAVTYLDRQYMLGDDLLVAPVFSSDGVVDYYVPSGTWTNILTGEKIEGARWVHEGFDYFSLPLLARPGAIIPMQVGRHDTEGDLLNDCVLKVYEPQALTGTDRVVQFRRGFGEDDGAVTFTVSYTDGMLSIAADDPTLRWSVECEDITAQAVDGAVRVTVA